MQEKVKYNFLLMLLSYDTSIASHTQYVSHTQNKLILFLIKQNTFE